MKLFNLITALIPVAAIFFCATSFASSRDDIGLPAFRAVTTNLNGAGISVAQPEAASANAFEVNPSVVGQPGSLFTYTSALGTTNVYPNSVGTASGHAGDVGNLLYGTFYGVATNLAHVNNLDADFFYGFYVVSNLAVLGDPIVNQSFTFGPLSVVAQQQVDSEYDDYAAQHRVLLVSAANNYGTGWPNSTNVCVPGTDYNCISVGAYYNGNAYNSLGPTPDNGRCKPDITAPSVYTSISTPMVSGSAALLMQAALRGDGGGDTNSAFDMRTIKALLLNGAVKPSGWTNGATTPLDARHGAGVVNVLNAYKQLAGGKQGSIVSNQVSVGGAHPPTGVAGTVAVLSGWDFATNTSSSSPPRDAINHYYFNLSNVVAGAKFTATATLVWNRQFNKTAINNLNLFLYNCTNSNLVASSVSAVDNVEHLYLTNLAQGRYDLQVWKAGGASIVSAAEPYALAWEFFPPPVLAVSGGVNPALNWPVYPAGFLVEARTNLMSGAWSTNGFSLPAITNGQNSIPLNPTNAAQFFRLRKPNL